MMWDWAYIGMSDETEEGSWVSWTGEIVNPFWAPGMPDNYQNEDCASLGLGEIGINDINCYDTYAFICYKKYF
ncbi:hypothetical protein CHS0354_011566 [Potamilus streckersoni]|uniref:C-type lectin domain-containing protein n=1 Tax=Potamilus streckersoni TaxID=2493646 RepID=A0AAE0RRE4_9BIVA|nr:hypothetical protein CHS0354_011566 [Potamilus streckersoni]